MDFPAGALTNFYAIDGFFHIFWRIYSRAAPESPASQLNSPGKPALRDTDELRNSLLVLRNIGCLVSPVANGADLWIFSTDPNFDALGPVSSNKGGEKEVIVVGNATLQSSVSGVNTAAEIKQRLLSDPGSSILNSTAPQNSLAPNSGAHTRFQDVATYSSLFEAFISAAARALILEFTQQQKVIPLGTRTLYSVLDDNGYQNGSLDPPRSRKLTSFLSTLEMAMTSKGELVVSLSTLSQPGLEQLYAGVGSDISDTYFNNDLWLAPSGILCRLIAIDRGRSHKSDIVSPGQVGILPTEFEIPPISNITRLEWKITVTEWLRKLGLNINDPEKELWVEVEVHASERPFHGAYSGSYGDQKASSPSIQILWPAKLCFVRSHSDGTMSVNPTEFFSSKAESPLQFVDRWLSEPFPKAQPFDKHKTSGDASELKKQQTKLSEPSPLKIDSSNMPESLARTVTMPDAQLASTVYPTPPGGLLAPSLGVGGVPEGHGTSTLDALSYPPTQNETIYNEPSGSTTLFRPNSDVLPAGLDAASSDLGVGSGLYDTVADEDFFGDMDGTNFDTKDITEADFNFFDEPEFAGLAGDFGTQNGPPEQHQEPTEPTPTIPATSHTMSKTEQGPSSNVHTTGNGFKSAKNLMVNPSTTSATQGLVSTETPGLDRAAPIDRPEEPPISPPLSPVQIKKILSPSVSAVPISQFFKPDVDRSSRSQNQYSAVTFQPKVWSSDKKYKMDGRFWFTPEREHIAPKLGTYPSDIPMIGFPDRGRKPRPKPVSTQTSPSALASDNFPESELRSPSTSSSTSADDGSITDIGSESSSPPVTCARPKRKRNYGDGDDSASSSLERHPLVSDVSNGDLNEHQLALLGIFVSDAVDWPLTGYFSKKQNDIFPAFSRREDMPQVVQLVVDQITQTSLHHTRDDLHRLEGADWDGMLSRSLFSDNDCLGHMSKLDLRTYATLEDVPNPRKDTPQVKPNAPGSICKIFSPHVKVHRGDRYLEVLPTAIGFWETFGLEPVQKEKNIIPFCIYPPNIAEAADAFMERMGLVYSVGNFGSHSRPSRSNGLVPWTLNAASDQDYTSLMHALNVTCEDLGSALSNLPASNENVVVYIVNPFVYDASLVDICSAFLRLFHKYVGDVDRQHTRNLNELVLQIVPLDFVASADSLVVPTQFDFLRLALEVYSRCPPKDRSSDWLGCAPPLVLADPVPKVVPFRLASESVAPLEEGKCLHVAYSQSVDQRWVTAAWTDNSGRYQTTLSYCLRERDSPVSRTISEIRAQIWETTQDIMDMSSSHWKLMIVKNEPVGAEEIEMWKSHLDHYNRNKAIKVELVILSVNIKPGLSLKLPSPPLQLSSLSQQQAHTAASMTTPGSTPRPVPSPDPSGPVGTPTAPSFTDHHPQSQPPQQHPPQPPVDSDQDTFLIDKSDETWGVTLSHRLNNSYSLTKYQPALASGYLFRRSGTSDTEGQAALSVNIIFTNSRRPIDHLLKDILRMYRELATLARARGIVHAQGNFSLPWHIMTAAKGQEVLSYTL